MYKNVLKLINKKETHNMLLHNSYVFFLLLNTTLYISVKYYLLLNAQ